MLIKTVHVLVYTLTGILFWSYEEAKEEVREINEKLSAYYTIIYVWSGEYKPYREPNSIHLLLLSQEEMSSSVSG